MQGHFSVESVDRGNGNILFFSTVVETYLPKAEKKRKLPDFHQLLIFLYPCVQDIKSVAVNYSLWSRCHIEVPPDVCPQFLALNPNAGQRKHSQVIVNITLALVAAYSLIRNGVV